MKTRLPTSFEQSVYDAISRIPRGCVSTYAFVAKAVGCGAAQAVGQALRRNPDAPSVPCHRVIASDLSLGGFCGRRGGAALQDKRTLLAGEGVRFDAKGRLADPGRIFRFERR